MDRKLCIECQKNPIRIKSRGLCVKCSQRFYQKRDGIEGNRRGRVSTVRHNKEMDFVRNFFKHDNWIYHPAAFKVNNSLYHPDFYDGERNIFIEVSGTPSAFYANRDKYNDFIREYPKISFEVRTAICTLIPISIDNKGTYPVSERKLEK